VSGPLSAFFIEDHRRLGALLTSAAADGRADAASYAEFRAGILRHIGMEERVLIPAARRARGGAALPLARLLRLDHGAIAALLVPPPSPDIIQRIAALLVPHNEAEERADGLYAVCDELLAAEADALLARLRAYPAVPLAPHQNGPNVHRHIEETLDLARRAWAARAASR
jgi:Hemerythrin HHE cation binding domain